MAGLAKVFGQSGKKGGPPTPQMAIQKLRETEEMLGKKSEFLEMKIEKEVAAAKKYGMKNKRAALMALKRKKRLEKQLAQVDGTLSTIEFQREAVENASTNTEVLKNMSYAAKALKAAQNLNIDDVHDILDDIQEQNEIAEEISSALSAPVGFDAGIDEDELLQELEGLEEEGLEKDLLGVGETSHTVPLDPLQDLPDVPSTVPEKKEDEEDLKELASWAT